MNARVDGDRRHAPAGGVPGNANFAAHIERETVRQSAVHKDAQPKSVQPNADGGQQSAPRTPVADTPVHGNDGSSAPQANGRARFLAGKSRYERKREAAINRLAKNPSLSAEDVHKALMGKHPELGQLTRGEQRALLDRAIRGWERGGFLRADALDLTLLVESDSALRDIVAERYAERAAQLMKRQGGKDSASVLARDYALGVLTICEDKKALSRVLDQLSLKERRSFARAGSLFHSPDVNERILVAMNDAALKRDPAALAAFDRLLGNSDFKRLDPEARIAVLSQAGNYPNIRSIENLERLTGRHWFREASLQDKQRLAKVIASAAQDSHGNITLTNTLNVVLGDDSLNVKLDPSLGGAGAEEEHYIRFMGQVWEIGSTITLSSEYLPPGNRSLDPRDAKDTIETLAHELNHDLTNGKRGDNYRYFMDEYRAWYVEYKAAHNTPPSQRECWEHARWLVIGIDGYPEIRKAFRARLSDDSIRMVRFMARIRGEDPAMATRESVLTPKQSLSYDRNGFAPVSTGPDDPNNLDNHP